MAWKRLESPVNIDFKAGARIAVRAEVPSTSVGRYVDAATDLFQHLARLEGFAQIRSDQTFNALDSKF